MFDSDGVFSPWSVGVTITGKTVYYDDDDDGARTAYHVCDEMESPYSATGKAIVTVSFRGFAVRVYMAREMMENV